VTPRVATVLSAREWESRLVAHARDTAAFRLVLRAYRPTDVETRTADLDLVVAGAETPWVTPARISAWRRAGLRVIGIHPTGDAPARARLASAGADDILSDDTPAEAIARAVRLLDPPADRATAPTRGRVVGIVGARGAPGRTEIAVAVARALASSHRTLLVDLDLDAPSIAIRLGLAPRPDVVDASDEVHTSGALDDAALHRWEGVSVLVASHRPVRIRPEAADDLLTAAAIGFERVVVDSGIVPEPPAADDIVLVAEGTPLGIVRAAHLVSTWTGPTPTLVLNRVPREEAGDVVLAARRWTGLEPEAVILEDPRIRDRARRAELPSRTLARMVDRIGA
jgi:Flp pilus assembly CpaE family ATPase